MVSLRKGVRPMSGLLADVKTAQGLTDTAAVVAIVAQLLQRARLTLDSDAHAARREIQRALELLSGATGPTEVRPGPLAPWQARRVMEHVHANLETAISVEDMASATRLSTSYFFRAFKRSFGVSPHAYVTALRLARARELLVESGERISAIAAACGFADQAHFSRVFRRDVGCAPGVWRREQRSHLATGQTAAGCNGACHDA